MPHQGRVGEQEKRFGDQRTQRGEGEPQNVAIKFSGDIRTLPTPSRPISRRFVFREKVPQASAPEGEKVSVKRDRIGTGLALICRE